MKRLTLALALFAAGCSGSSTGSTSTGGSTGGGDAGTAVSGSVAFSDPSANELQVAFDDGGSGYAPSALAVQLQSGPSCQAAHDATRLVIQVSSVDGAALQPGHYNVGDHGLDAVQLWSADDAGTSRGYEDATDGALDVDAVGPPALGRFYFTFASGTLQGSFDAPQCP